MDMVNKSNIWYIISGCVFAFVLGSLLVVFIKKNQFSAEGSEVDWRVLGEMDYITGKAPDTLNKFNGAQVKIPGFMVPLEDSQKEVTEFLLVPTPQACIHVPAPPPNQMVYVKMKTGKKAEVPYGPIWVHGQLNMVTKKSMYGDASFELIGESVENYK